MSEDRWDKWVRRFARLIMMILGSGGFGFEILSPHRSLWVGLLCVGLLAGNVAALVDFLSKGVSIKMADKDKGD